ncbi:MAG: ABC transporter ATP-binding protein [Bdellovibrionota bacterium]
MSLNLRGLSRQFDGRDVLRTGDLCFKGPGLLLLKGKNGSGKSTLLKILATLLAPTAGDAVFGSDSVVTAQARVRTRIGWVGATEKGFFDALSGRENLRLFATLRGLPWPCAEARLTALSFLDLEGALSTRFGAASSGMKQKLLIVRALLHEPEILLLDEPARSLDQESVEALRVYLVACATQKLVILASHQREDQQKAHEIWSLRDGRLAR